MRLKPEEKKSLILSLRRHIFNKYVVYLEEHWVQFVLEELKEFGYEIRKKKNISEAGDVSS